MAQVTRSVVLGAPAADVWTVISGFQALVDWHPAIESSTREDRGGVEHRRLALKGGGEVVEKWLGSDAHSYAYTIVESPLPVADYYSVVNLVDLGGGRSAVVWCGAFTPTAENAEEVIAGVYQGGLDTLAERFGR